MDFQPLPQILHLSMGFVAGLGTVAWRIFSLFQKVAVLEERVKQTEDHTRGAKGEIYRWSDRDWETS